MDKKIKGFKEFMKTPRQVPAPPGGHPVPPGYKRVKDHIAGWKLVKVEEGVGGALIGGIAGGLAGGPLGAVAGAYAGHKITQRSSQNKSMVDAFVANKAADVMDRRRARKAAAAGQTRFRPGAISRYLRNVAIRKSGGIYAASPDGTEPVAGFVRQQRRRQTPPPHPTPAPQRNAMARAAERVQKAIQAGKRFFEDTTIAPYVHSGDYIPKGQSASRELARRPTTLAPRPGTSVSVPPGSSSRYIGGERTRVSKAGKNILKGILKKVALPVTVASAAWGAKGGYEADPTATTGEKLKNAASAALSDVSFGVLGKDAEDIKAAADARKAASVAPTAAAAATAASTAAGTTTPPAAAQAPATTSPKYGEKGAGENVGKFWTGKSWQKPSEMSDEDRYGRTGAAIRRLDPEKYKTRPGTAQGNIELLKQLQSKGK